MPEVRLTVFSALVIISVTATFYSVTHDTFLDTSNPLLTHLPHPLSHTHYFANKSNFLNVYFIKKAWAWTSAVFLFSWFTSPLTTRTAQRMWKWVAETVIWLIFTGWFFGPALFERVILASGGECVLALPNGDPITIPVEYCLSRIHLSPTSHPSLFISTSTIPPQNWSAMPRLRKGHDISGHIFLLTMSTLFLADQLQYSLRFTKRGGLHTVAMIANLALIGVWLFATYTTCVYFHSPLEKASGFCVYLVPFVRSLSF